jgi:2-phospho-L-lactate guanylyltransferase
MVMETTNVFAIVPVKGLDTSKMRLSSVLSPEKRRQLTTAMLESVLDALKASAINEVLVVSPDLTFQEIADKHRFSFISPKEKGLNPSLNEAVQWCLKKKADSVLILPADIPLVSSKDIDRLVELGSEESTVVLSPSGDGGTNALFLNPPNLIPVCFGPKSFFQHVKEALDKGATIKLHSSRGIMLDVDSEEDLKKMLEIEETAELREVLRQIRQLLRKTKPQQLLPLTDKREGNVN